MMLQRHILIIILVLFLLAGCGPANIQPPVRETKLPIPTSTFPVSEVPPAPPVVPSGPQPVIAPAQIADVPYDLISKDTLLAYLEGLTSIQPYSGWRNSASSGEAEALDYVESKLLEFPGLRDKGLNLERQEFPVYLSTEIWDSRLILTVGSKEIAVPADGLRGSRGNRSLAIYFDTDGLQGDSNADPIIADGSPIVVRDGDMLYNLTADEIKGRILFLDYALIDGYVLGEDAYSNGHQLNSLVDRGLAGVVLMTQYSNRAGESHGTQAGEGGTFLSEVPSARVPVLLARIEDMSPAGIANWEDLSKIQAAHLVLDSDTFSPGKAGNLIARIPGSDSSKAVILGAHIDSPNSPGAFDNGSGSAALLEVARVLEVSQFQPPVDVYLAWFGGHEIGTYGSAYFAATHQELLDRTLGLVQMDCLGHPLDGRDSKITMLMNSYGRFGEDRTPMPDFLTKAMASQGLDLDQMVEYGLIADNSNFDAFNVPNVYLGYLDAAEYQRKGSYIHYSNHFHDPYETVDLAREEGEAFVGMTKVLLSAALEMGRDQPVLRVTPAEIHRALFVSSHTEAANVPTSMLRELGMALAWEGFDVDLIPYAHAITPADLTNVDFIVLPPALTYPGNHDEGWSEAEIALLKTYVAQGGLLVVTNSSCNYSIKRCLDYLNDDTLSLNPLLEPMGVAFTVGAGLCDRIALAAAEHPLMADATYLSFYECQGVPLRMDAGLELVRAAGRPLVGLVDYGSQGGQVLVIADLGILQVDSNGAKNMEFLKNIARYASNR